jgi:hypothetical protein
LRLIEAGSLRRCAVRVLGQPLPGDRVTVLLDCNAAAATAQSCAAHDGGWELGLTVSEGREGVSDASATVSYEWVEGGGAAGPGWVAAVDWDLQADRISLGNMVIGPGVQPQGLGSDYEVDSGMDEDDMSDEDRSTCSV